MIIGFTERNIIIPESGTLFDHNYDIDVFYFYHYEYYEYSDEKPKFIEVASERTSEISHTVVFNIQESTDTVMIGTFQQNEASFDVLFGEILNTDGHIQQTVELTPGEDVIILLVKIVHDLDHEDQECFTINISPTNDNDIICNDDENATNYFCSLTICIDDNDGKFIVVYFAVCNFITLFYIYPYTGPIRFSFDQETYIVAENDGSVEVCASPNRTLLCREGPFYYRFKIVVDMDLDNSTSGIYKIINLILMSKHNTHELISLCRGAGIASLYSAFGE